MVITNVNLNLQQNILIAGFRDRVIASGVALLAVYAINFIFQAIITYAKKENRAVSMRKLTETSQVLYWFGVASMFSIFPPFYYGAFNAIIAYITLIIVVLMHIFCISDARALDRSLHSIFYFFYHLLIAVWLIVGLILAYIWSNSAYQTS